MNRKASLMVRLLAKSIDFIIVLILMELFKTPGFFGGLLYILISDGLFHGRSIGKFLTNLRVIKSAPAIPLKKSEETTGFQRDTSSTVTSTNGYSGAGLSTIKPAGTRESVIRNSPLFFALLLSKIPILGWIAGAIIVIFELIMLLGSPLSKRLGDELAGTEVIEIE